MIGFAPLSTVPLSSALQEWRVSISASAVMSAGGASEFRLFSGTREFITEPGDTPGNQPVFGTLLKPLLFERSIINGDGFGRVTVGWGEMEIVNTDGEYDQYIGRYAVDGRRIVLRAGLTGSAYGRFATVFDGTALDWQIDEDVVRIPVRDNGYKLAVQAQANLYGGTGGLDGSTDLKGKRKPKAFGEVLNVSPPLVDPAKLLYQAHDGPMESVLAVYDRGVALTAQADYATAALLNAATIAAGRYSTCVAEGFFRLGAAPAGTVTADLRGDKAGGTYVTSVGAIVQRLVAASTTVSVPADLDTVSFAQLDADQPALVGYWLAPDAEISVEDVVADLMASIGGWAGFTRGGLLQAGIFKAPSGAPVGVYDQIDVVSIERQKLPGALSPPPWRFRVAFSRNWTVQQDLAGAVGAARVAQLAEPWRVAESANPAIKSVRPLAQDPPVIEAYFRDEGDAQMEADRRLALFGRSTSLYRVVIKGRLFSHDIGQVIRLTYPRWDLSNGRLLRLVAVREDTDTNLVELTAFG